MMWRVTVGGLRASEEHLKAAELSEVKIWRQQEDLRDFLMEEAPSV